MVKSGIEGFMISQGPFNYFGIDALTKENYIPDFTAEVASYSKLLRISKENYDNAIKEQERMKKLKKEKEQTEETRI